MAEQQTAYDVVVSGGRVMDPETGLDAVRNVGINGSTIAEISDQPLNGKNTVDASGHVVSPGFIDCHVHTVDIPIGQKTMLRGGVTTQLDLEAGAQPVDRFYDYVEPWAQANYGAAIDSIGARQQILVPEYNSQTGTFTKDLFHQDPTTFMTMDWSVDFPTKKQVAEIIDTVEAGIKQGALGIGVAVGYMVAGCTPQEILAWQRLAGQYGLATFVHGRFSSQRPPTSGILGFEEFLAAASIHGGGVFFHHMHQQALDDTADALELFAAAREKGLSVAAEIYPYNFGASIAGADYLKPDNYKTNMGHGYDGITEIETMKPLTKERYDELQKTNPGAAIMFEGSTEEVMIAALLDPNTVIGSDAFPMTVTETGEMAMDWDTPYEAVQGHPRAAGTSGYMLRMARENEHLPLMTAISKMSYMIAVFLEENGVPQMANKGRLQVGADADLAIFDPDTVTDNSTIEAAGLPTTGIPTVLVNGTIVVANSKVLKDVHPGKPVRNPVHN